MKTLHLLRHAKSSWDDNALSDVERPLAPRGQRATAALRTFFANADLPVDLVLLSPARRARETWAGVASGLRADPPVRVEPRIYEASVDDLLAIVHSVDDDDVSSLLLVGHNPGFEQLAIALAGKGEADALANLQAGYPTGGFASLDFDETWSEVRPGNGRLLRFVRPRELED